jgi:hypothetical protein
MKALKNFAEGALVGWLEDLITLPWRTERYCNKLDDHLPDVLSLRVLQIIDRNLQFFGKSSLSISRRKQLSFSRNTSSFASGLYARLAWEAIRTEPFARELLGYERQSESSYTIEAPLAVLVQALAAIRNELAQVLPSLDDCSFVAANGPSPLASRSLSLAICAGKIVGELYWDAPDDERVWMDQYFYELVAGIVYPSWRRTRDVLRTLGVRAMLSSLDFRSFIGAYLDLMSMIFNYGLERAPDYIWSSKYSISAGAWKAIERELQSTGVTTHRPQWTGDEDKVLLEAPFASFVEIFDICASRLLAAIDSIPPRRPSPSQITEEALAVAAHGIFVPEASTAVDGALSAWAVRRGIAPQAALPDTPRVLVRASGEPIESEGGHRQLLERCTLVHEHFHAILETGLDARQVPAVAPREDPDGWRQASALNEALAAWMELHFLRRHAVSLGTPEDVAAAEAAVWAYIRAGDYSNWPYRGAETVRRFTREMALRQSVTSSLEFAKARSALCNASS